MAPAGVQHSPGGGQQTTYWQWCQCECAEVWLGLVSLASSPLSASQYRFSLIFATLISSWFLKITIYLGFPHGSAGKRIHLQCRRLVQETGFDPWVGKIPWRREQLPTPVFWPEEFQGLYSPCGRKESDAVE